MVRVIPLLVSLVLKYTQIKFTFLYQTILDRANKKLKYGVYGLACLSNAQPYWRDL